MGVHIVFYMGYFHKRGSEEGAEGRKLHEL